MKSLHLIIFLTVMLCSCAGTYKPASSVSSQAYVGMSISEFKKIAGKKAILESLQNGMTVYKMYDYDTWTGGVIDTKFFYFDVFGNLAKIDGGVMRQTRQEIDLNIKR